MGSDQARPRIVLASASPRRSEILERMGYDFVVVTADIDESPRRGESPASHVRRLAREKATAARSDHRDPRSIFLGADTVVVLGRRIMGKPVSHAEARRMLRLLSGRPHRVLTALALLDGRTGRMISAVDTTTVVFRRLSPAEIAAYVRTGEPMDKAGAYAIQGGAALFVDRIEGNFLNVVGFPATLFVRLLGRIPKFKVQSSKFKV